MRSLLKQVKESLSAEEFEEAKDVLDELHELAECPLCVVLANHTDAGVLYVANTPPSRREAALNHVVGEIEYYIKELTDDLDSMEVA